MPEQQPVVDYAGNEIKAGMTVVYPVREGSRMWLSEMTVTQVIGGTIPTLKGANRTGHRVTVKKLENVVIIQRAGVTTRVQ